MATPGNKMTGSAGTESAKDSAYKVNIPLYEGPLDLLLDLIKWIAPVRERRVEYEKRPRRVLEMIDEGSKRARVEAKKTMERVREAVFGWEKKKAEVMK